MNFPAFFDDAPQVRVHDPLAGFLGSVEDGALTYRYQDAVRLCGHSCPVVAGAWLMVLAGLEWLYGGDLPERGGIEVHMRDGATQGTTGVTASVAGLVTGAAAEGGFHGIGARHLFSRRGLLRFEAPVDGIMGLRRRDSGAGVVVDIDTGYVPHDPAMADLMSRAVQGLADKAQQARFSELFQDRVRRMFAAADDPKLIHLYDWPVA
ncbi:hypothetical protein JWJ88_18080 [Paracoccus methylovorus]|uniref:Formylmethanofuran dehydrogenase subunit E domain-containing protein n=1 Tax=Paracoccus methylovorus TaxID=2812658 RepID=A0ABX7JKT0_9RHOB|nr:MULTISPECIES: hypothetical protein [Paracoccus]QRZ14861.1 hypothetical protein JWJ88_18080 [Paracoccus methylovorus]